MGKIDPAVIPSAVKERILASYNRVRIPDHYTAGKIARNLSLTVAVVRAVLDEHNSQVPGDPVVVDQVIAEIDISLIIQDKINTVLEQHPDKAWTDENFRDQVCQVPAQKWRRHSEDPKWADYRAKHKKLNLWAAKDTAAKLRKTFSNN